MDEPPVADSPTPPVQHTDYDLVKPSKLSDNPPPSDNTNADFRSPAAMMRSMGFDPCDTMTPLQFLIAVMNDQTDLIYKQETKKKMMKAKGIGMNYRIEAAKTAAKFIHMSAPQVTIATSTEEDFSNGLAKQMAAGNERIERKTVILETVERISPDAPLPPASYPPQFSDIQGEAIVQELDAEGDTQYDPDRDD